MVYLYLCKECDETFEIEKSMYMSNRTERCPNCKDEPQMVRVYTAPATKTMDGFKK